MEKCPKCGMELKGDKCSYCSYDKNNVKKSDNKVFYFILALLTIVISLTGSYLIVRYTPRETKEVRIKDYSNITIKDEGISAAVLKVYDAVVVVSTYSNDRLYATGTGFVFKKDDKYGYILTNHHVIEDGKSFKVRFTNEEDVDAEVVDSDSYSDIAVLKVPVEKIISIATLGSTKDMLVGDTVFTIGSPVDADTYSWTVTRGILSGKDRIVEVTEYQNNNIMNVIQTDAAINQGNSGGPLCNASGEVIGITNMKLNSSYADGMGFAIPIEIALEYASNFIEGKAIVRPYLGVAMYDLSNSLFSREKGIYIREIEKESPAAKAGLEVGDVIIKIDGKEITSIAYLKYYLYKHEIGDEVLITYKRKNEEKTAKVILGSYDVRG